MQKNEIAEAIQAVEGAAKAFGVAEKDPSRLAALVAWLETPAAESTRTSVLRVAAPRDRLTIAVQNAHAAGAI